MLSYVNKYQISKTTICFELKYVHTIWYRNTTQIAQKPLKLLYTLEIMFVGLHSLAEKCMKTD